jgi:hypothetical protein
MFKKSLEAQNSLLKGINKNENFFGSDFEILCFFVVC